MPAEVWPERFRGKRFAGMKGHWFDRSCREFVLKELSEHLNESVFPRESWDRTTDAKAQADEDQDEDQPHTPE